MKMSLLMKMSWLMNKQIIFIVYYMIKINKIFLGGTLYIYLKEHGS